jgi:hypothetical protein
MWAAMLPTEKLPGLKWPFCLVQNGFFIFGLGAWKLHNNALLFALASPVVARPGR